MDRLTESYYHILLQQKRSLEKEIEDSRSSREPIALDQSTQGRLSRVDAMQQQAMAIAVVERKKIMVKKIEAAMDRCNKGVFGICCDCGDSLSEERLRLDPATPFCKECLDMRQKL